MKKKRTIVSLDKLGILDEIREVFYQNTGLIISFHQPEEGGYDFYPKFERNEYCKLMQSTPAGLERCFESDGDALAKAKNDKNYCLYTCHAGLTNAVINLEYEGVEIGSIYTGQILTSPEDREGQFEKVYEKSRGIGISYGLLKDAFFNVKVIDENKLLFGARLLYIIANYIISVEDELYLQKEIFGKDKEILEYENEKIKLENELQKLRISILEYNNRERPITPDAVTGMDKNSHIVLKAQSFIKSNYHKKIMLNDVAESVYLSPNYFSTVFKEISGDSFSSYLQKTRIKAAKKILMESDMPVKSIVTAIGMADYNYFNRIFRKLEGIPPAAFRIASREAAGNHN